MDGRVTRREFHKEVMRVGMVAAGARGAMALAADPVAAEMPKIKLGHLRVSRLFLGSNPFFGFSHGNPQASADEMKAYYTPERIMATLDAAADQGITGVWTPCYEHWIELWLKYKEKGGRLDAWIAQPDRQPMERDLKAAIKNGAKAICIQGCQIDGQVSKKKWDVVRGWLELIKSHNLPAGMATHGARTHLEAEEKGLPTDFYHQPLYRPDNYVREGLEESLATIEKLAKPVVAYKVLGAGRILPKDTLPEVLKRLKRKDGICLGVFPKKRDEIAENAALVRELTAQA
ncbi:MAG: hypothetical protein FJ290_05060 [Planctomycetes bacterium]|nr:hypothetical protein [Planctomycetota bacterium]